MATLIELQERAEKIDRVAAGCCTGDGLLRFLRDSDPIHEGLGSADVDRLRAYTFAALARSAPTAGALAAREEIETGITPVPLAGAARVVAELTDPNINWLALLAAAARRIRGRDQKVWFDRIEAGVRTEVSDTAMGELARAFASVMHRNGVGIARAAEWLDAAPDSFVRSVQSRLSPEPVSGNESDRAGGCCCSAPEAVNPVITGDAFDQSADGEVPRTDASSCCGSSARAHNLDREFPQACWTTPVEDQAGARSTLGARLLGRPAVLAFFYTRCMNPLKCSRTVSVLAETARLAAGRRLAAGIFGITYDPAWDNATRLSRYGFDRNMPFAPDVALLRATLGWDELRGSLDLAVGYGPSTVNRHRIEVLILDGQGRLRFDCQGRPPEAEQLVSLLTEVAQRHDSRL